MPYAQTQYKSMPYYCTSYPLLPFSRNRTRMNLKKLPEILRDFSWTVEKSRFSHRDRQLSPSWKEKMSSFFLFLNCFWNRTPVGLNIFCTVRNATSNSVLRDATHNRWWLAENPSLVGCGPLPCHYPGRNSMVLSMPLLRLWSWWQVWLLVAGHPATSFGGGRVHNR